MNDSMLSILAFGMVATFMTLIMTKRLSALVALILVPTVFALLGGFAAGLGEMMLDGVRQLAPTGVMLLFAILYFGVMIDAGLFDPLIVRIVAFVGSDPVKILVGTAVLALLVSLDGDGTTTYMITVSAMLPLYRHLKLDVRAMACVIIMAAAVTNLLPWGGPTARAASALRLDPATVFMPMVPAMLVGAVWVLGVAWWFGCKERTRLSLKSGPEAQQLARDDLIAEAPGRSDAALRPKLFVFNALLTAVLMVLLILGVLPLAVLFMLAFAVALMVNYPSLAEQKQRLSAHAGNALAFGIFPLLV